MTEPTLEELHRLLRAAEEDYKRAPNKATAGRVRELKREIERVEREQAK